jgi:pimeloyl-ACP methyl ester carboxylesterase
MFRPFLRVLPESWGAKVQLVTLRDHGVGREEELTTIDPLIAQLVGELQQGGPHIILGSSLGAYLACKAAEEAPGMIAGMVLAGGFITLSREDAEARKAAASAIAAGQLEAAQLGSMARELLLGTCSESGVIELASEMLAEVSTSQWRRALSRTALLADPTAAVRGSAVKSVVVHGARDKAIPVSSGKALAELLGAPFIELDTDSHLLPATHPEALFEALALLSR